MSFWTWSRTASSNGSADSTINFAEGMAASAVNDSARALMAAVAKYRDDVSGARTLSGTSTAYTLTSYQVFDTLAHMDGARLVVVPNVTSGASPTLNVDGLGAKPIRFSTGVAIPAGALIAGTPYAMTYFNSAAEWIVNNATSVMPSATVIGDGSVGGNLTVTGNETIDGTLGVTGVLSQSSTSHELIPVGTTGQRPASQTAGRFRYNSTIGTPEIDNGSAWVSLAPPITMPQGRLTLTSVTPTLISDVSAATTVYYTPYNGNLVPIYDGTVFNMNTFSELSLALVSNHLASTIYDIFVVNDSGTIRLVTGPAWNTSTAGSGARGTGAGTTELERVNGLWVNKVDATMRYGASTVSVTARKGTYVGSLYVDGSAGQVSCLPTYGQSRKWGIWNAYNRQKITLQVGDATSSWTYTTSAWRQARATAANVMTAFVGLPEETFKSFHKQNVYATGTGGGYAIGIGVNSTSALSGFSGIVLSGLSFAGHYLVTGEYAAPLAIGITNIYPIEYGANVTFMGGAANMNLMTEWWG